MASIERSSVAYFSNAIKSEKQTDTSSVNINDLKIYLTSAPKEIRNYVQTSNRGDLPQFLARYPEVFQVEHGNRVFLTADVIKLHGAENLEKLSVEFFVDRLRSMKAFQNSPIPVMALKRHLNEAPSGIQSLFSRNYFGKDFKRFFCNHPDVFGVSNSGNVYLIHGSHSFDASENSIPGMFSEASGIMENEISQDEKDAVSFYRRVLNSPGIELQACSIDSLFAQLCEAPDNVQRFLHKNYNEVNFLDFFNAHKEVFNISMSGQTSLNDYAAPAVPPSPSEFPPLMQEEAGPPSLRSTEPFWESSQRQRTLDSEEEAITFFQNVVQSYALQDEIAHVEKLRDHLANAPLIVFSYFHNKYPYREFEKFFLNHASHFTIDSSGAVALAKPGRKAERVPPYAEKEATPQWKSSAQPSSPPCTEASQEEDSTVLPTRNRQFEVQLEKFFLDVFHVAHTYNVCVVSPGTLLAISACLNRRLSTYLSEQYGKDLTQFFQQCPNRFRVSKNGNICLAVEKDFNPEASSKKTASDLTAEFFVSVLQLLQNHQVKAVAPEVLWEFLPLGPPKVNGFLAKHYEKETFRRFFLEFPRMFAISKNKNVYLAAGSSTGIGTDTSDDDSLEYVRASGDPCEVAAIEFFIDRIRSLKLSCYPIPLVMLRESLVKASPRVRGHFEETYPQDKFLDFFVKYKDFFFVMQPINVVWLTRMDSDDLVDEDSPAHCPLSNRSKIFRQVIGVVAADLLLKSPRPFSTILGHLYGMVSQHSQELGKYPGKSNTERLCSLLSSCFNMFKIVKDNVILSWPLKHSSSLLLCLEEALAGVCVQLARHDTVSFSKFYTELRLKAERMFQCFIPDACAMLSFLRRREEFYVLNPDQFIAVAIEMPDEQVDEVTALIEKELRTRSDGVNLQLILSSIREERFQHSYTCGVIMNVIMKRKDKFYLSDGRLFLKEDGKAREPSPGEGNPTLVPAEETSSGTGWITNVEEDGGTVAAALGSNTEYGQVRFYNSAVSNGASGDLELSVGDEVEFVATRKDESSDWVLVSISKSPCEVPQVNGKGSDRQESADRAGSLPSFSCESSNEEDDESSTNGDDRIFYSSASDMDPPADAKSDKAASRGSSKEAVSIHGTTENVQSKVQDTEASWEEDICAPPAVSTSTAVPARASDSVCSEDRWSSTSGMSHVASMLSLINTDEDETPYDRRIMNSMSSQRLKRMKEFLNGMAAENDGSATTVATSDAENSDRQRSPDRSDVAECYDSSTALAEGKSVNGKGVSSEAPEAGTETWDGTGIWDVEPFVEVMEAQHMDMLKETKVPKPEDTLKIVQEEDWEAELTDTQHDNGSTEQGKLTTAESNPVLQMQEEGPAGVILEDSNAETLGINDSRMEEDHVEVSPRENDDAVSVTLTNEAPTLHYSRDGSSAERPSLAEELNLDGIGSTKDKQATYLEAGAGDTVQCHCQTTLSSSHAMPEVALGVDSALAAAHTIGESPHSDLPCNSPNCSDTSSTPHGVADDAIFRATVSSEGIEDTCTENPEHKSNQLKLKDTDLLPVEDNSLDIGSPLLATIEQIDSSTVVLRIDSEALKEIGSCRYLRVGNQIAIHAHNFTHGVSASADTSQVAKAGSSVTKDTSAQTISTGAIFSASLVID